MAGPKAGTEGKGRFDMIFTPQMRAGRLNPADQRRIRATLLGLAAGILGSASGAEAGAFSKLSYDLRPFMTARGLAAKDVHGVFSTLTRTNQTKALSHGLRGPVRPAYVQLSVDEPSPGSVPYGVKINFDPQNGDEPVKISACPPVGSCDDLSVEETVPGSHYGFSYAGEDWSLRIHGSPCDQDSLSCSFRFSSWALEQRRASGGAAHAFPKHVLAVDHKKGLALIDPVRNEVWKSLGLSRPPLRDLGRLEELGTESPGLLKLTFASGALLIDAVRDRSIVINDEGIFLSAHGLGNFQAGSFDPIRTRSSAGSGRARLLRATDELVLWSDGYVSWDLDDGDYLEALGPFQGLPVRFAAVSEHETELRAVSLSSNQASFWRFDAQTESFQHTGAQELPNGMAASRVRLRGSREVMVRGANGMKVVSGRKEKSTSFGATAHENMQLTPQGAFVKHRDKGTCRWVHYDQHARKAVSFKESGLELPCSQQVGFGESPSHISATSFDGERVSIRILTRNQGN